MVHLRFMPAKMSTTVEGVARFLTERLPTFFPVSSTRMFSMPRATVKWFNPAKGFGFVTPSDGGPDAFLHISAVEQTGLTALPEGTVIDCYIAKGKKGPQVEMIKEVVKMGANSSTGGEVVEGTVKFYNEEKGFGFVSPDSGGKDVFVGNRVIEKAGLSMLEAGQRVCLSIRVGQKGPMADSISLL